MINLPHLAERHPLLGSWLILSSAGAYPRKRKHFK